MKKIMYIAITLASFVLAMASGQALAAKGNSDTARERVQVVHFKGLADADDDDLVEGIDYIILEVSSSALRAHRGHGDILVSELPSDDEGPSDDQILCELFGGTWLPDTNECLFPLSL